MSSYERTVEFWDDVFSDHDEDFDYRESLSFEEIEGGLDWLVSNEASVIDFGCGNGKLLMRCLAKGAERGVGLDISPEGIQTAKSIAVSNDIEEKTDFFVGGIVDLKNYQDDRFDAGILSNVLDNLIPKDARKLIDEFQRIIKPGGKIFLKLNDYIEPKKMEEFKAEEISDNFYREESGIYFWNLEDDKIEDIIEKDFSIKDKVQVEFAEEDQSNRLYYIKNE